MSYILDALQRAQAERERGAVPGLYSHSAAQPLGAQASRWPWWLALSALLLGLAAWLWWAQDLAEPAPKAPSAPERALAQAPAAPPPVTLLPGAPLHQPPSAAPVAQASSAVAKPAPSASPTAAPPTPVADGVPETLRAQVGELRITGAVYAKDPAQRLLLVNNLVLQQGQSLKDGLVLEAIEPKSALFNFKGARFRLAH